jgi:hypothetical protein
MPHSWKTPNAHASHLDLAGGLIVVSVGYDGQHGAWFGKIGSQRRWFLACQNGQEARREAIAWAFDCLPKAITQAYDELGKITEQGGVEQEAVGG